MTAGYSRQVIAIMPLPVSRSTPSDVGHTSCSADGVQALKKIFPTGVIRSLTTVALTLSLFFASLPLGFPKPRVHRVKRDRRPRTHCSIRIYHFDLAPGCAGSGVVQ